MINTREQSLVMENIILKTMLKNTQNTLKRERESKFEIADVKFSGPATIVFWKDGTKTVVRAQLGEKIDPEKGLAMAISKKALGNKYEYYHTFLKYLKKY